MGLLGIEIHPNFQQNRRVFIGYSSPQSLYPEDDYNHTSILTEFKATSDGRKIKKSSERTIMEIPQPKRWHQSGDIIFGADGYLYIPMGNGGS